MKNAFTNNRILLKSLYCAIIDKAFNFSPVFLQTVSMWSFIIKFHGKSFAHLLLSIIRFSTIKLTVWSTTDKVTFFWVSFHLVISNPLKKYFWRILQFQNNIFHIHILYCMVFYHLHNLQNQCHPWWKTNHIKIFWIKETLKLISGEIRIKFLPKRCMLHLFWFFVCGLPKSCTNVSESALNPYAFNFAIKRSYERQSKALERSVSSAQNLFWLSNANFHFSGIDKKLFKNRTEILKRMAQSI